MEPFVQYAVVSLVTIAVMLLGLGVYKLKPKVEPLVERTLEQAAIDEFKVLANLISARQQQIVTLQASLAADVAKFNAAKVVITGINVGP
jgi:hypothetical protein